MGLLGLSYIFASFLSLFSLLFFFLSFLPIPPVSLPLFFGCCLFSHSFHVLHGVILILLIITQFLSYSRVSFPFSISGLVES